MPRGRTRDADAHQRILDATFDLLGRHGSGRVRIDDIAVAAGVGKQTIYRWWPTKQAVVVDALLHRTTRETPFKDSGDVRRDLRNHLRGVVRLLSSPTGALIREVVADARADERIARDFVDGFWQPRRDLSTAFLRRAVERGHVRDDLEVDAVVDALYAPLWIRLLIGHRPLDYRVVDDVLGVVWPGLRP